MRSVAAPTVTSPCTSRPRLSGGSSSQACTAWPTSSSTCRPSPSSRRVSRAIPLPPRTLCSTATLPTPSRVNTSLAEETTADLGFSTTVERSKKRTAPVVFWRCLFLLLLSWSRTLLGGSAVESRCCWKCCFRSLGRRLRYWKKCQLIVYCLVSLVAIQETCA